jgi:SAM-dependent methyltransferase
MDPCVCPVCADAAEPTDRFRATPLQRCRGCGLVFRGSVSEADVLRMYSDDSYAADRMDALTRHRSHDADKRARWTRAHTSGSRLLEVGAGAGFFVKLAGEHGFDAIGIEPSELSAQYARSELGVDVRTGFLGTSGIPPEAFDVVCMWHVLEHVADPLAFLEEARARLCPGGRLVLEVPNVDSVGAIIMKDRWAHLDPAAHVCHFAPGSLETALERARFEVLHLSTLVEGYYDRLTTRMRPRRIAGRAVRGLRLRTLRLTHPRRGELLRAVAARREA